MTNNHIGGKVPQTIDSNGNIIDKPYGVSRWSSPKVYPCGHNDCSNPAIILRAIKKAHNCCTEHEEGGTE